MRGKIEEFQHRAAHDPLVSDQRLDDVGVRVAGARDQFSGAEFSVEIAADFPHAIVVILNRPFVVLVLQFDLGEKPFLKFEERTLQARLHQVHHRPDFAFFLFFARHDLGLGHSQDLLDLARRIVPAEAEGRGDIVHRLGAQGNGGHPENDEAKQTHHLLIRDFKKDGMPLNTVTANAWLCASEGRMSKRFGCIFARLASLAWPSRGREVARPRWSGQRKR